MNRRRARRPPAATWSTRRWDAYSGILRPIALTQPLEAEDSDDDGLCATGCECVSCPPEADPGVEGHVHGHPRAPAAGLSSGFH